MTERARSENLRYTGKTSKMGAVVMLLVGLHLAVWELWDRLDPRPLDDALFHFYTALYFIALGAYWFSSGASSAVLSAMNGAFLLVLFGTFLLDAAQAFGRGTSEVWLYAAAALGMGFLGVYWLYSVRASSRGTSASVR